MRTARACQGRGPTPTQKHSASESTGRDSVRRDGHAAYQRSRHAGSTEPASSPPRTPEGTRRTRAPKRINSHTWVSNTGYQPNPQAKKIARGKIEADGAPTVPCAGQGARRHRPSNHHSHARSVRLTMTGPNVPTVPMQVPSRLRKNRARPKPAPPDAKDKSILGPVP